MADHSEHRPMNRIVDELDEAREEMRVAAEIIMDEVVGCPTADNEDVTRAIERSIVVGRVLRKRLVDMDQLLSELNLAWRASAVPAPATLDPHV